MKKLKGFEMEKVIKEVFKFKKYKNPIVRYELMPNTLYVFFENEEREKISIQVFLNMCKQYLVGNGWEVSIVLKKDKVSVKVRKDNKEYSVIDHLEWMAIVKVIKEIL